MMRPAATLAAAFLLHAAVVGAPPPADTSIAAATMEALFTDLDAARVQRAPKDSSGAAMLQLDVLPRAVGGGYMAVNTAAGGVGLSTSADLREFRRRGTFAQAGASAPTLVGVTGRGPAGAEPWWVLAFETGPAPTAGIGFALFTSEAQLLSGNASRVFVAPNAPLLPAGQRVQATPARYSSPTIYSAVYSQRGGQTTVDVVLGVAWTDNRSRSHPANAILTALSPSAATEVSPPEYHTFFSFDGEGYDGRGAAAAGPLHWEMKLRQATSPSFSYTGSSSAYVPCGPGCADPRDRAGGNADGMPGTIKLSIVAGIDGEGTSAGAGSKLLLWAWDPIVKVAWLWPSGFGTAQGGFNNSATVLRLPGVDLAAESTPKVRVLPCPDASEAEETDALCLWVGLMTKDGQLAYHKPLTAQRAPQHRFSPRFRTLLPPPPPPSSWRSAPAELPARRSTRSGLTLRNDAFRLAVAASGATFTVTELQSGLTRRFGSTFAVVSSRANPLLTDLKDAGKGPNTGSSLYSIADSTPSYWRRKQTLNPIEAGDGPAVMVTASSCAALNDTALSLSFSDQGGVALKANLALPPGTELPRLSWSLTTSEDSFFSVGFVGAPGLAADDAVPFAQPANCGSTETANPRCPLNESVVLPDIAANLPYAMVSDANDSSVALIADPSMFKFQPCVPWPDATAAFSKECPTNVCPNGARADACQNRGWATEARSSLGISRGGKATPLIYSPVFGGFGSQVSKLQGRTHSFTLQLLVHRGSGSETYRKLASIVYGFRDERDNSGPGSLNAALERMSDYLADADGANFLQWDFIQKYSFCKRKDIPEPRI
eukprot:COSAG04_NODE_258_length_18740_cov_15.019312_4_plen_829_part_00